MSFFSSKSINFILCAIAVLFSFSCADVISSEKVTETVSSVEIQEPKPGIYDFQKLLSLVEGKRVAIVSNHTGLIGSTHIVDSLLSSGVELTKVFAPEHGFRGDRPDGEEFGGGRDSKTGLEIISLYGENRKPTKDQLGGLDLVLFDIQDVGARFYTYLSTLHYVIQACSENQIPVIVADRPNPHVHYVDGPVMEEKHMSFVGLHPVPIVYGMTIGEYAKMIVGERWHGEHHCDLTVLPCIDYSRSSDYNFPMKPSPNLPTMNSIYCYPSLCLFEGTVVSAGRGTDYPFTIIGEPNNQNGNFQFTPEPKMGASISPKHKGVTCIGYDLRELFQGGSEISELDFTWLVRMYNESSNKEDFFLESGYFEKLAGTDDIRNGIVRGESLTELRSAWEPSLNGFKKIRAKYLIYD